MLLPDLIVIGSKWFQARFFTAPLLSWVDKDTCCQFGFELDPVTRLIVRFTGDRLVSHQPDGASIYRCRVSGPRNLDQRADGECETDSRGNIFLWLYHHTDTASADAILESGHFRGSAWNIQGTVKKLTNAHYVYLTSLARVTSDDDLKRIAMATNGLIPLTRTNAPKDIMWLKVFRASTSERQTSLRVLVPAEFLASQHVYYEAPHGGFVYYAVCHPQIFRVGLLPGRVLPIVAERIVPNTADLKRFDYVVLGHADTRIGLRAPYDEENTPAIFKIEYMRPGQDLFFLWRKHSNTDRFTGYAVEMAGFKPS